MKPNKKQSHKSVSANYFHWQFNSQKKVNIKDPEKKSVKYTFWGSHRKEYY